MVEKPTLLMASRLTDLLEILELGDNDGGSKWPGTRDGGFGSWRGW